MCQKLLKERMLISRKNVFMKGNEPEPMAIKQIRIVPCACGKLWANIEGNDRWVECERVEQ